MYDVIAVLDRRMDRGYDPKRDLTLPASLFNWVVAAAVYCYVVVYLGAYIRHTTSGGGCLGWPLCNGQFVPEISGATGFVFIHRVAGLILFFVLLGLLLHTRRVAGAANPVSRSAAWVLILVICQIFSGAWLTATIGDDNWFVFTNLVHNLIVTIMFSILMDLGVQALIRREGKSA